MCAYCYFRCNQPKLSRKRPDFTAVRIESVYSKVSMVKIHQRVEKICVLGVETTCHENWHGIRSGTWYYCTSKSVYLCRTNGSDVICTMRSCLSLQIGPLDKMGVDTYPTTYHIPVPGYVLLMWRILLIQDTTLLKYL
jgi:hypothetical protein